MNKVVINAEVNTTLPTEVKAGVPFVIQLAPKGEYPNFIDDPENPGQQKEVVQILDDESLQTLVSNFNSLKEEFEKLHPGSKYGVLVDADHSSEISTNTAAMAWVRALTIDPELGLMAEIEPTSLGAEKINGKVYRFVSGAWTLNDETNRAETLCSIGLTNKPNLPVAPMINSKTAKKDGAGTVTNAGDGVTHKKSDAQAGEGKGQKGQQSVTDAPDKGHQNNNPEKEIKMNELKEILGLAADASDADVVAAVKALSERVGTLDAVNAALNLEPEDGADVVTNEDTLLAVNTLLENCGNLQNAQAEAEQAQLNAEAEEFVAEEENAEVIPEDEIEAVKNQYIEEGREAAETTVANYRKVYERAVLNCAKSSAKESKPTHVRINAATGRKPVALNFNSMMAECGGDPAKMNAAIAAMHKKA